MVISKRKRLRIEIRIEDVNIIHVQMFKYLGNVLPGFGICNTAFRTRTEVAEMHSKR